MAAAAVLSLRIRVAVAVGIGIGSPPAVTGTHVHTWFLVVGMIPPLLLLLVVDIPRSLFSAVSSTQENENASCASPP